MDSGSAEGILSCGGGCFCLEFRLAFRKGKEEAAASAYFALDPHAAPVLFDDALADSEAEAGAPEGAGVGGVALLEDFEDHVELFLGDAAALVFDDDTDFVLCRDMRA